MVLCGSVLVAPVAEGVDRYNGQQVRNYTLATDMQFSDASGRNIKLAKDSQQHIYAYDNKGKIYI